MGPTDWDRIFSLNASSLTDDEIEELCPTIIHCKVDEINDVHNLQTLVKLSQETLQYKDNQVESLLLECGELKEMVSSLKSRVAKQEKKGARKGNDNITEMSSNFDETLRKKNEKVQSLMAELETLDRENAVLKESLSVLKEEMEDATDKMDAATEELNFLRINNAQFKEKISDLEQENSALVSQVEEISAQQLIKDKVIDEFGAAIDARIGEWKALLDSKDEEIASLKEELSRSFFQTTSTAERDKNEQKISSLYEELSRRDEIIREFQEKLSQATAEINENAAVIEKFKNETKKIEKSERKSAQRDLIEKLRIANDRINKLQEELQQAEEEIDRKSNKLSEVLSVLKKYEDKDAGLTDALSRIKFLESELQNKNEHVEDLISVVNKLEMLNSYQEMEIVTLREKLGISKDEHVSVDGISERYKEQARKMEMLVAQNKMLLQENIEMKSDIRTLKYKLRRSKSSHSQQVDENSRNFLHSTKLSNSPDDKFTELPAEEDSSDSRNNAQLIIEENEALRQGLHEILDSIRNQDGKSSVEVQSSTLENLLEALDIRHLAGWYHPAMRLQERLNVVQGSNAELRSQLKQLREELQRKDEILQKVFLSNDSTTMKFVDDSQNEKLTTYLSDLRSLESVYEKESKAWEDEKNFLEKENRELKDELSSIKFQLESYQESLRIIESGEEDLKREFALKSRECIESRVKIEELERKTEIREKIHAEESARAYQRQKEEISKQAALEKLISESNKRISLLECELSKLENDLLNSVSLAKFMELEERHEEFCSRFRAKVEDFLCRGQNTEVEDLKIQLQAVRQEKDELLKLFSSSDLENDVEGQVKAIKAKAVAEKQRADMMTKMREVAEVRIEKLQNDLEEVKAAKVDLQERLIVWQKRLWKDLKNLEDPGEILGKEFQNLQEKVAENETLKSFSNNLKSPENHREIDEKGLQDRPGKISEIETKNENLKSFSKTLKSPDNFPKITETDIQDLRCKISELEIENENLKRILEISQQEVRSQFTVNSLRTLELDNLRHQILDLQAASEDKAIISRLDFELMNAKVSETESNARQRRLEEENSRLQIDLEKSRTKCEEARTRMMNCRKQYEERCRYYVDTIQFLQEQYIGSTTISGLERIIFVMSKLDSDRQNIDFELTKARESQENAKLQEDLLGKRLEIVEKLKDILEQQIGSGDVQEMLIRFSEDAQHVLNDFKYKRRIAQLEYELKISSEKMAEYELMIRNMEKDTIDLQRAWYNPQEQERNVDEKRLKVTSRTLESASVQVQVEVNSVGVETDIYKCCLNAEEKKDGGRAERGKDDEEYRSAGNVSKENLGKLSSEQLQGLESGQLDDSGQSGIRKVDSQDLYDEKIGKLESTEIPELDSHGFDPKKLDSQGLLPQKLGSPGLDSSGLQKIQSQNLEPQRLHSENLEAQRLQSQNQETQNFYSQNLEAQKLKFQNLEAQRLQSQNQEAQNFYSQNLDAQKLHSQTLDSRKLVSQDLDLRKLSPQEENLQIPIPEKPYSYLQPSPRLDPTPKDSTKPSSDPSHLSILHEQLQHALDLASERSATINKYESQLTECRAMVDALNRVIQSKDKELAEKDKSMEDFRISSTSGNVDYGDRHALKSTINSLQRIVSQKEETIIRYQNLLKEDRDVHHKEEFRLKEELKLLREKLIQIESKGTEKPEENNLAVREDQQDFKDTPVREDEIARMQEKISNLQADLSLTKELRDRWHRLAEERLDHMDLVRERLEEEHKKELESYRAELQKWQSEADTVRQQLSETRMLLTKGNISLSRELQERDDKINELTLACQKLQSKIEVMQTASQHLREDSGVQGISHNRDQSQSQLRRQLQTLMEKEKMYKHEVAELKQKLSRKYMAQKTQEKKTSQREMQLEKKVKTLEEELQKAQTQLDREFLAHEVKRVKTAEEVSLWDKQKRWQQTAEKLKEKLKEKSEECTKLQTNSDRLRSIIASMEREKTCLMNKMKSENVNTPGNCLSARSTSTKIQEKVVSELREECQILRERVREMTGHLEGEKNRELAEKVEEQARRIAALELAGKGNSHVVDQLEKLEQLKDALEKANVKLEAENFELRFEIEKANSETPKLKEKVEHLTKYVELLKAEKSSDSASSTLESVDRGCNKSASEMQKTIFALRRIVERLQVENKRLRMKSKNTDSFRKEGKLLVDPDNNDFRKQYEEARKRSIALEIDLQLAEQRIVMLEAASQENDNCGEKNALRQQLNQKSDLLDRLKHLLTKAAINEKNLRRRIQQLESRQTLSAIPECYVTSPSPE